MNNYRALVDKLEAISGTVTETTQAVEECGMPGMANMPSGMMGTGAPKQQDNVTMNLSMNGSGAGGIRDLMNILKDIQGSTPEPHDHDADHGEPLFGDEVEENIDGNFGSATTQPNEVTLDIDDVVNVGTPINGGDHRPRQAGLPSGNPNVHEGLVNRLADHDNNVKNR